MLLGDPKDFAIEVVSEPFLTPPSAVWGRMCIHIGAVTLGDFSDAHCGLYPSYLHFDSIADDVKPLWDSSFDGLTFEQIYDCVRCAIYGDDVRSHDAIIRDAQRYGRYDFLTNWGEQFDWYASVIVQQDPNTITIMHRPSDEAPAHRRIPANFVVAHCTHAGFIGAAKQFVHWFEAEAHRLSKDVAELSDEPQPPS